MIPGRSERNLTSEIERHAANARGYPKRGNRLTKWLADCALLLTGWRVEGGVEGLAKAVVVGAPHYGAWDFVVTVMTTFHLGVRANWLGKRELFSIAKPVGALILRWLGGIPVERGQAGGLVQQLVGEFNRSEQMILAILPEGSRKRGGQPVHQWKLGFYYIALGAGVPVVPAVIDNRRKRLVFHPPVTLTGDVERDLARIQEHYEVGVDDKKGTAKFQRK